MSALQLMMARARLNHMSSAGDPYWSSVVTLLHFDGADNSTTFTDGTGRGWTALGGAKIVTAQSKFGGSSKLCPQNTIAPIYAANATALQMGSGDFTIEGWFLPGANSTRGTGILYVKGTNTSDGLTLGLTGTQVMHRCAGMTDHAYTISAITGWTHVAWVRASGTTTIYVGGSAVGSFTTTYNNSSADTLDIGSNTHNGGDGNYSYSGYMDEFRITKGVARYTGNFTPPSEPFPNS